MYVCMYVCMYVYDIWIYIYVCIYIYIYGYMDVCINKGNAIEVFAAGKLESTYTHT